jgi:hypothetical protein
MNRVHAYANVTPIRLDQVEVRAVVALGRTNVRLLIPDRDMQLRAWIGKDYAEAVERGDLDPSSPVALLASAHATYVREKTRTTSHGPVYSGARA